MTDRDFKLLVREYFQAISRSRHGDVIHHYRSLMEADVIEKRILSELEAFTEQEQQELPFKD